MRPPLYVTLALCVLCCRLCVSALTCPKEIPKDARSHRSRWSPAQTMILHLPGLMYVRKNTPLPGIRRPPPHLQQASACLSRKDAHSQRITSPSPLFPLHPRSRSVLVCPQNGTMYVARTAIFFVAVNLNIVL